VNGYFWGYLKKKASLSLNLKVEMLAAIVIADGVLVCTIQAVSPFGMLMTLNDQIKDYWEGEPVTAPVPHAEELSIRQLAARMGCPVEQVLAALQQEGLHVEKHTMTVAQLAEQNRLTPSDVHAAIQRHFPEAGKAAAGSGRGLGDGKGGGFGSGRGQGRGPGRKSRE